MKRIFCSLIAFLIGIGCCTAASATTVDAFDGWAAVLSEDGGAYTVVSCTSDDADITVPDALGGKAVTQLAPHTFLNNTNIQSLTLREPLIGIGEYAFLNCTQLRTVMLPASLRELGAAAFSGASELTAINLSDTGVSTIREYTFMNTPLQEIRLPSQCTAICDNAFRNCHSLQAAVIPSGVTEIGESAFDGCENLTIYCEEGSFALSYAVSKGIHAMLTSYLRGDADGDGTITILDATRIQRLLADLITDEYGVIAMRGDLSGNGLDILDATAIQRYLAGMGNLYGVNEYVAYSSTNDQ